MNSPLSDHVIGIPVSSVAAGERSPERPSAVSEPVSPYQNSTPSDGSPTFQKNRGDSVIDRMSRIREHVRLGPKISETVKGKLRLGARIIQRGGMEKIFKQIFNVREGEKLLKASQCYLSTTAGPMAGLLFISTEKVAFCSERSISFPSSTGELVRTPYKVLIPLSKIKRVNQSENVNNPAQKYIEIDTVDNFDFWFMGFLMPILLSQDLFGYVHGTIVQPFPLVGDNANPDFHQWRRRDQYILSWINDPLTESVLAHTVKLLTSHVVWKAFENSFAQQSHAKSMHLHGQLQSIQKGSTFISDALVGIQQPVSDNDLVNHTLYDLTSDYEAFITAVTNRFEPIPFEELRACLLQHEQRLVHLHPPLASPDSQPTALYNQRPNQRGSCYGLVKALLWVAQQRLDDGLNRVFRSTSYQAHSQIFPRRLGLRMHVLKQCNDQWNVQGLDEKHSVCAHCNCGSFWLKGAGLGLPLCHPELVECGSHILDKRLDFFEVLLLIEEGRQDDLLVARCLSTFHCLSPCVVTSAR
ncbi:hypothetical protein HHK36_024060 [Tetracentron sinense]|uniref:GRAM domain-containing protein n=1 Tax=Tetracentron sinense TaxID=13715 RepID=A0A834YKB2_TETSI|nr:hypothetical protein HHK36_024060 [Tetracentron sinense]